MPIYATRLLQEQELEIALNFAWPIAQQHDYFYFPFYNSSDELKEIFSRYFERKGLYLIGIFEENMLVALFPLVFRDSDEMGTLDKGIYIHEEMIKYAEAMDIFKTFISKELTFEGKKIYCGIRSDYQDASNYFESEGSEILEETYITNLKFEGDFLNSLNKEPIVLDPFIKIFDTKDNTNICSPKILNAYFEYHDKAYPGYYWTSERLRNHLHDFRIIFALKQTPEEDVIILGSIFVREIEGTGDVYGLSDMGEPSEALREVLFHKAMQNGYADNLTSMMFFCDDINDYHLALKKGFKTMGNYTVYLWKL